MNKLLFFIILLFFNSITFCQNTAKYDSLIKVLPTKKNDTNKINTLNEIVRGYFSTDINKALEYAKEQLKLSQNLEWKKGIEVSYYNIGKANYLQGNYSPALENWLKDLQESESIHDSINIQRALSNIGSVYEDLGNYTNALEYDIKALKLAEKSGDKKRAAKSLFNIATVHVDLGDQKKALEYFLKSLNLAKEIGYKELVSMNLGDIGNVYRYQNDYSKALEYYFEALKIDEQLGNKRATATWLSNIGITYHHQSELANTEKNITLKNNLNSKALEYNLKAIKLLKELGDNRGQALTMGNIGCIYTEMNNYSEAETYLQKALVFAEETNYTQIIITVHFYFYNLYKKTNAPVKALEHYEKYVAIKDSLDNENNKKAISELQIKYETKKNEIENNTLIQKNKIQALTITNSRYLMIGLVGFFLLVLGFGILIFRQNKLKAHQLAVQFEQKLLRTQMNPHFIFNSLASIESYIYEHDPKSAGVYLSHFSRLMRLILENSASEFITLDKEIDTLKYYLSLQKLRFDDSFTYSIDIDDEIIPEQIYIPPMLLQPFIENAIEHGFKGSKQQGVINVEFSLVENNLFVKITDNGIGIARAQQQKDMHKSHKSMAMQITNERLKILNKSKKKKLAFTISDISDEQTAATGTKVVFSIPV